MRSPVPRLTVLAAVAVAIVAAPGMLSAQARPATPASQVIDPITHEGYIAPPDNLARLVDAPRGEYVNYAAPSPVTRKYLLRTITEPMPPLALMGKEHHNLAGWQIDNRANRARNLTTRSAQGFELLEWETGRKFKVELPPGTRANAPTWSPDGKTIAYFANFDDATHIYLADAATGKSRPLTKTSVLATNVTNITWTSDGKSIIVVLVPDGRGPEPKAPPIATEPIVRVNENNTLRTRTFADLIGSPFEKNLLEYHMTGQLAVIDVKTRAVTKVGAAGMIRSINAAPDGQYFRVVYLDKPFSYYQQIGAFGTTEVLLDATGKNIREINKRVMREGTPDAGPDDPPDPTDTTATGAPAAGRGARAGGAPAAGGRGGAGGQGRGGAAAGPQAPDTSRRSVAWHPFETGQMFFQLSALPSGAKADSAGNASRTDRLMLLPNLADTMATKVIYETPGRIQSVRFSDNGRIMFVTETVGNMTQQNAVFLDEGNQKFTITSARGGGGGGGGGGGRGGGGGGGGGGRGGAGGGAAAGGGAFVTKIGSRGVPVVMTSTDGKFVFVQGNVGRGGGAGAAPDNAPGGAGAPPAAPAQPPRDTAATAGLPNRPYVEKIEIRTQARTRIYESNSPIAETIVAPLDDDFNRALVRRESRTRPGQSYILDLRTKEVKQITDNKDLFPEMRNLVTKTVFAKRADGLPIRVRLTLPAGYREGTRLPALFWFYPSEYDTPEAYTRTLNLGPAGGAAAGGTPAAPGADTVNNANTGTFQSFAPRSMAFITTQGYALVEPDAPIVATEGLLPNDNYISDLRNGLLAVIDALDTLGYIDRHRLGLGGHSYGAFSTVNAMVNTPFFKAGIAGDGAYNRLLTPNGFQSERRTLWQGTDTYLQMSPFLKADELSGALLLYHSTEDQNVGTDPINSIKLFHALQGLGKNVSMYMYPYEDHGPIARETVLDQWARWVAWLDKYVKNAGKPAKTVMN